jgi:hypothetical protein
MFIEIAALAGTVIEMLSNTPIHIAHHRAVVGFIVIMVIASSTLVGSERLATMNGRPDFPGTLVH